MPVLLDELWRIILLYLYTEPDDSKLWPLREVNSIFFNVAMDCHYHTIHLDSNSVYDRKGYALKFSRYGHPLIGPRVRSIMFTSYGEFDGDREGNDNPKEHELVMNTLATFVNLTAIRITSRRRVHSFTPLVTKAITCSGKLTLFWVDTLPHLIKVSPASSSTDYPLLPALRDLRIFDLHNVDLPIILNSLNTHGPNIRRLTLQSQDLGSRPHNLFVSQILKNLNPMPHLQFISLSSDPVDPEAVKRFVAAHSDTLTSIVHTFLYPEGDETPLLAMWPPLPHLQSICLHGFYQDFRVDTRKIYPSPESLLDFLRAQSHASSISNVELNVTTIDLGQWAAFISPSFNWSNLRTLVLQLPLLTAEIFHGIGERLPELTFLTVYETPWEEYIDLTGETIVEKLRNGLQGRVYPQSKFFDLTVRTFRYRQVEWLIIILHAFPSLIVINNVNRVEILKTSPRAFFNITQFNGRSTL